MFVQTLPSCVSCIKLDFIARGYWDAEQLNFEELCVSLQENCPHLQMLILCEAWFTDSLTSVIDLCTQFLQNVRRLAFYYSRFINFPSRQEYCGVSKIEALDVVKCYFDLFDMPPLSKIPCLRELNLHGTVVNELLFENDIPFLNQLKVLNLGFTGIEHLRAFQTILNHTVNLKELYLCNIDLNDSGAKFNNLVFPHLKTICLRSNWTVTCEDDISFIQSCPSLENIYVNGDLAKIYAKHSFVVDSKCMLEIVKVHNFCDDNHKTDYFRV